VDKNELFLGSAHYSRLFSVFGSVVCRSEKQNPQEIGVFLFKINLLRRGKIMDTIQFILTKSIFSQKKEIKSTINVFNVS